MAPPTRRSQGAHIFLSDHPAERRAKCDVTTVHKTIACKVSLLSHLIRALSKPGNTNKNSELNQQHKYNTWFTMQVLKRDRFKLLKFIHLNDNSGYN